MLATLKKKKKKKGIFRKNKNLFFLGIFSTHNNKHTHTHKKKEIEKNSLCLYRYFVCFPKRMCINKNPEILEPEKPYTHKLMNNLILSFCCSRSRKRKKVHLEFRTRTQSFETQMSAGSLVHTHTKEIQNFVVFFFFSIHYFTLCSQ